MKEFESKFSDHFNIPHTLAVSSGSSALKVSLQALGVGRGDEVITQAHTFIATVEAIRDVGARPVIVNIDESLNMDPKEIEKVITVKTKAIIPVHMGGVACKLDQILKIAEENSLFVLEDNAQSPGGTYNGKFLGTFGDAGIFSFDGGKMLTTGEGGMIVTPSEEIYKRARGFSDHGHADNPDKPRGEDDCIGFGFNHKMTELQGAVGCAQIEKLRSIIVDHYRNKTRMKIYLRKELENLIEFREIPNPDGDIGDSLTFFLPTKRITDRFVTELKNRGFGTKNLPDAIRWHTAWSWGHIQTNLSRRGYNVNRSKDLIERAIALPIRGKMSDEEIDKIVKNLGEILRKV